MKGIIIAGGRGTRLQPLTFHRPKPLVPVVNRPFLEYQVTLLRQHGIDDIVFATNYMADKIQDHFGDGIRAFGVRMRYAVEETPLGTGGAIRNAADCFPGEPVVVFNGDVLTDYNLSSILQFHQSKKAIATITLQPVSRPNPFGVLKLEDDSRVAAWIEPSEETKKALAQQSDVAITGTDLINAGFYVFEPEFIQRIAPGKPCSVERDVFPPLLAENGPVYGIAPGGFWMDLGRAEQLMAATRALLTTAVHTSIDINPIASPEGIAEDVRIDGLTSIGRNVIIESGARISDCIIMDDVQIGGNTVLSHLIVDAGCRIEADVVLEGRLGGATPVIAANSAIRRGSRLGV